MFKKILFYIKLQPIDSKIEKNDTWIENERFR